MKKFEWREIEAAVRYAAKGGQALHLHTFIVDYDKAPSCFVNAVERGENIAHLFDQDIDRLEKTARRLGVRIILVEHAGSENQHIDLCGQPLRRAVAECDRDYKEFEQGELF